MIEYFKEYSPALVMQPEFDKNKHPVILAPEINECLYRLWYNDRYIIWKGKSLGGSFAFFEKGSRYYKPSASADHKTMFVHKKMFDFIKENPGGQFLVELLLETNNHYKLLQQEHDHLERAWGIDLNCMNTNRYPHILQFNHDEWKFGWLDKGRALNFFRWFWSKHPELRDRCGGKYKNLQRQELAMREMI